MGPRRDVVGEWQKAAKKQGLKFGVSEHLGASFTWWQPNKGSDTNGPMAGVPYDGADPKWQDLYHWPAAPGDTAWYSTDPRWHQLWFARIKGLVDQYRPDLLYSDGALPFGEVGRTLLAHYYNANQAANRGKLEAVYCWFFSCCLCAWQELSGERLLPPQGATAGCGTNASRMSSTAPH